MRERILLVDDDERILDALKRRFYRRFKIETVNSAVKALKHLEVNDYAVVVSDQRMPEMDGVTFLSKLVEKCPDTVRIMLTGNSDQQTAVSSINEGKVFRYLNKPCSVEDFAQAIVDGISQYRVDVAERELLQKTLAGSVKLLTDILAVNNPDRYRRIGTMRIAARNFAKAIGHPRAWELDLTVLLSSVDDIVLPAELSAKMKSGKDLSAIEQEIVADAPKVARDLLLNIPKLKPVANAIYYKGKSFDGAGYPEDDIKGEDIPFDARILHLLADLLEISGGLPPSENDIKQLEKNAGKYDPALLNSAREHFKEYASAGYTERNEAGEVFVNICDLRPGDQLVEPLITETGKLALAADNTLTEALLHQTRQFNKIRKLKEPVRVLRQAIDEDMIF